MIDTSFSLPCGQVLPNRICKAAMTERLCNSGGLPNFLHNHLYKRWAETGTGLHLSGNIMCDGNHLESAGNVVVQDEDAIPSLKTWTKTVRDQGARFWAQISHPGRQTNYLINHRPVSASSVWLKRGGLFMPPRSLVVDEISDIIERFATTAKLCIKGGFEGIQIHAAHGYLISQFLSPMTNRRRDNWGGSLENRARLLLSVVGSVKSAVPAGIPVSVKLNSADFQRGGFDEAEAMDIVSMLDGKIDLLEISGGTYEKQAMMGEHTRKSTLEREAYFLDFARRVRTQSGMPIMVTGGFRSRDVMMRALQDGHLDLIGIARPFCTEPDAIRGLITGSTGRLKDYFRPATSRIFTFSAEAGYYAYQLIRLAEGKQPDLHISGNNAALFLMKHEFKKALGRKMGLK